MDHMSNQKPNEHPQEVSYDELLPGSGGSGGKTVGSASAGEISFDVLRPGSTGSGGKGAAGSASAGES